MSTNVSGVTTNFFPTAQNGFTTTTSGSVTSGAATVGLNSVAGYSNGDVVVLVIDPTDTNKKQTFTGVVDTSGSQITSVKWTAGTNQDHVLGATVVDYETATHWALYSKGLLVSHDPDGRLQSDALDHLFKMSENIFDFVASGCVWSGDAYGSTRAASMTAGVVYINGVRVSVSAVTARTFTASKDTYIDVGTDGVVDYNESTNNAASQALAANHVRLGIIVTGASNIANVGSVNQGQEDKVLPIVSSVPLSVTDTIGNLICPRDPQRRLLGYKQRTSNAAVASATPTAIAELSVPFIVPTGRKVKVTVSGRDLYSTTANAAGIVGVYDGAVGGTLLGSTFGLQGGGGGATGLSRVISTTPSSTSKTYNVALSGSSGTGTVDAASTDPFSIRVELG